MSTTTGATDAQIEAAAITRWETQSQEPDMYGRIRERFPWSELTDLARRVHVRSMRDAAQYLVPTGKVIASAADVAKVPTAEEIAAIRDMRSSLLHNVPAFDGSPLHVTISAYLERVTG